jgi:hypothetical protein
MIERALRFPPNPSDHANLCFQPDGDFAVDGQALIVDETPGAGCGLVLFDHPKVAVGAQLRLQIGYRDPVRAEVVWTRVLPQNLLQVGVKFLA